MKILIDMQGMQSESFNRGIGLYSKNLINTFINGSKNDFILLLNGKLNKYISDIYEIFQNYSNVTLVNWFPLTTITKDPSHKDAYKISQSIREAKIKSLLPDLILITSFFEEDTVLSIDRTSKIPEFIILYDLIPLHLYEQDLSKNILFRSHYYERLAYLNDSEKLLAISKTARDDVKKFFPNLLSKVEVIGCSANLLNKKTVKMNNGNFDHGKSYFLTNASQEPRKNIEFLIKSYCELPVYLKNKYKLVISGNLDANFYLNTISSKHHKFFLFTGRVTDDEMSYLFCNASLFIFPSLLEGFGMPVVEAAKFSVPVIGSNIPSIREIIKKKEFLFNPRSRSSLKNIIKKFDEDFKFKAALIRNSSNISNRYSWKNVADNLNNIFNLYLPINFETANLKIHSSINNNRVLKFLFIKLDHMGDFAISLPHLSLLKKQYPNSEFEIITGSWNYDFAKSTKLFKKIYIYNFYSKLSRKAPNKLINDFAKIDLKLPIYDCAIDLRPFPETRIFLSFIKSRYKIGYTTNDETINSYLYNNLSFKKITDIDTHFLVSMKKQLNLLFDDIPHEKLSSFKRTQFPKNINVGIFPYSGNTIKEWGIKNYNLLINFLINYSRINQINIFIPDNKDFDKLLPISKKIKIYKNLKYSNLLKKISDNNIIIGNNSFAAHISSILNLVFVGIYLGHGSVLEWQPNEESEYYIFSKCLDCSPCNLTYEKQCMHNMECRSIKASDVFNLIKRRVENIYIQNNYQFGNISTNVELYINDLLLNIENQTKYLCKSDLKRLSRVISKNFN